MTGARPGSSRIAAQLSGVPAKAGTSAIVNAIGPIRQVVQGGDETQRRFLVIVAGSLAESGKPVRVQSE